MKQSGQQLPLSKITRGTHEDYDLGMLRTNTRRYLCRHLCFLPRLNQDAVNQRHRGSTWGRKNPRALAVVHVAATGSRIQQKDSTGPAAFHVAEAVVARSRRV